jgi:hypothetical protein
MIILPGDFDAVSLNDDTCLDGRVNRPKIFVNAQLFRQNTVELEWFFRLLSLCPNVAGELKSEAVWSQFKALRSDGRDLVWNGLAKVRIHIVDPGPHIERTNDVLRKAWHRHDAPELLAHMSAEGVLGASRLRDQLVKFTAESILMDSTAVQVHQLGRALGSFYLSHPFFESHNSTVKDPIQVKNFDDKPRSLLRDVTAWTAKSAAAFESALHCVEDMEEEIQSFRYFPEQLVKRKMESRVLDRHAFDEGHPHHIELLEDARACILETLSNPMSWLQRKKKTEQPGYAQFDSRESYFGQAADIAAGFARHLLEEEGLVGGVSRFEYVTYNGERMSLIDAEEQARRNANLFR